MSGEALVTALLTGLLGGVHCAGMCGGIVGALAVNTAPGRALLPLLLAYNAGRLLSYTAAGAAFGGIGALAVHWGAVHRVQLGLQVAAGLFMLALGLYLAGWWRGLARLEQAGAVLWRRVEPLGRRFLPVRGPGAALALGVVWGWLPCGLVYSMLAFSLAAGGAAGGAAVMLAFGLGTLPNLLLMGLAAGRAGRWLQHAGLRTAAGLLVMGFGVLTLYRAWMLAAGG